MIYNFVSLFDQWVLRYRPITPGPLYEAEALSWWPGTEDRPLSRGDSHHATKEPLSPQDDHRAGRVMTPPVPVVATIRPVVATMAETVFFAGEKLATPIMPAKARPQSRGGASAAVTSMLQQFQGPQMVPPQAQMQSPPSRGPSRGGSRGSSRGGERPGSAFAYVIVQACLPWVTRIVFRLQGPPAVGSSEGPQFYF